MKHLEYIGIAIAIIASIAAAIAWQYGIFAKKCDVEYKCAEIKHQSLATFSQMEKRITRNDLKHSLVILKADRRKVLKYLMEHPEDSNYQLELKDIDTEISIVIGKLREMGP